MKPTGLSIDLSSRKFQVLFLLIVVVSNFILKLWFVNQDQISFDEPWTIFNAQQSIAELFQNLAADFHPPFYFVLEHFSLKLFGDGVFGVRIISLIFSALTIIPIFLIGRKINARVACLASLLFFSSSIHMYFSHEARAYSLLCFLTCFAFYFFIKVLEDKEPSKRSLIWFVMLNSLLIYTHFFSLFLFLSQAIIILIYAKDKIKLFTILYSLIGILFIPYLPVFYNKFFVTNGIEFWLEGTPGLEGVYNNLWKFTNSPIMAIVSICLMVFSFVKIFLVKNLEISSYKKVTFLWLALTMLSMFLFSYKTNIYLERYLLFVSPALYIVVASAIYYLFSKNYLVNTFSIVLVGIMLVSFNPKTSNKLQPKEMVEYVKKHKDETTLVLILPEWSELNFSYHYNKEMFRDHKNLKFRLKKDNIISTLGNLDELKSMENDYDSLILIIGGDHNPLTPSYLLERYKSKNKEFNLKEFNGYKVYFFNLP